MRNQLSARDKRMAKTIGTVCTGYLICNMPIIVYKTIRGSNNNDNPYLLLIFSSLFWVQCSFNFIIYAASNKQYREAYFMFLRLAVFRLNDDPYMSSTTGGTSNRGTSRGTNRRRPTDPGDPAPLPIAGMSLVWFQICGPDIFSMVWFGLAQLKKFGCLA